MIRPAFCSLGREQHLEGALVSDLAARRGTSFSPRRVRGSKMIVFCCCFVFSGFVCLLYFGFEGGINYGALCMLGKYSTSKPQPQLLMGFLRRIFSSGVCPYNSLQSFTMLCSVF